MSVTPDTDWGAFDQNPPWVLQLSTLEWQEAAVALREPAQREVPVLTKPTKIPPVARLITVVFVLSKALLPWVVKKKLRKFKTPEASRAYISPHQCLGIAHAIFKAGLGVEASVDTLTYRDLQARRNLIQKRMRDHVGY